MGRLRKPEAQHDHTRVSFDTVRAIASKLDGAIERLSYGTPAFFVGKTLFARQHQDGESLVIRMESEERTMWVQADPIAYSVTEHYRDHPLILVRMASVERDELHELLVDAWRLAIAAKEGGPGRRRKPRGKP
jgi:hypothetical protein